MNAHTQAQELGFTGDPGALFDQLTRGRPDTILLESADGDGLNNTQSLLFVQSALRVTAEGRLLLCLGQEHSIDLRRVIRANPGDKDILKQAIVDSMQIKPKGHEFDLNGQPVIMRHMNATGG